MPKHQFDVEVLPEYLPEQSAPDSGVFSFAYTITITNSGEEPAQLISRHWIISDARGHTEEVKGLVAADCAPPAAPCMAPSTAWPKMVRPSTPLCPCLCWKRWATAPQATP